MPFEAGKIQTYVGTGEAGYAGDGGPALEAVCTEPFMCDFDSAGNLFYTESRNNIVRRVDKSTGIITTVAGTGESGYGGDGGPATSAYLNQPVDVALDEAGNLFIADTSNDRIRRVDAATGIITTVAGNGSRGFSGDGGPATSAILNDPNAVALDVEGNLFIADSRNNRIRRVDATTGIITTVAGNGSRGFSGDGEAATSAQLYSPEGVAVSADGTLVIADTRNRRIRQVGTAVMDIDIDVKPGSTPNSINPTNEGVIPVAVLASETFDVSGVDGATLVFGKNEASPAHDLDDFVIFADHLEDVNGDGFLDLVSHYLTAESGIAFGDLSVCISGKTLSGAPLRGCDAIRTVPDIDGDGLLDIQEESIGTNVFFADSDGDGYDDGQEVLLMGTDPLDPLDPTPVPVPEPASLLMLISGAGLLSLFYRRRR